MNVQLVDELRELADWFRLRVMDENADLLDHAASTVQCAADFCLCPVLLAVGFVIGRFTA